MNSQGYEIAHPTLENIDVSNVSDLSNPEYKFVVDMINVAKSGGGFTYYSWYLPYSQEIGPKINYCLYYEPWDWIIVSSIYLVDFNYGANKIIELITINVIVTIILSIIISIYISKNITKPLIQITNKAKLISEDNLDIDNFNISNNDETGILAHYFKEMTRKLISEIENRKAVEAKLKDLNSELESQVEVRTSELLQNIKDLEKAHIQLVESERLASLGNIVSGVTHEINTPLGSGLSTASHIQRLNANFKEQLLENKMTKTDLIKYIDQMDEATDLLNFSLNRAADLVQSFKLIAVNQHSNNISKFYICDYIQKTLLSLKHEYKNSGHKIEFNCDNDFLINSYPGAYSQIITNLLMNALVHAFNEGQKGIIVISVTKSEDSIILSFKDNGVGIDDISKGKIFEPFFTTSKEKGGSGLGLNLVYDLVTNQLKGSIECISELNKGTEFIIKTPANS